VRSSSTERFLNQEVQYEDIGTARIAYRRFGKGAPLVLVHGWPLWGFTFRKIIPILSGRFTCYVVDLPGAGETRWTPKTDFKFAGQASSLKGFIDRLGLKSYSLLAHDTGATIARQLCLIDPERVERLVAIDTEIPGHRPPWIPLFQKLSVLPGNDVLFRLVLRSKTFLRSSLGFGGLFNDLSLLEGDFHDHIIAPMIQSPAVMSGQRRYLQGIDWTLVDSLADKHRDMKAPVLLIWGEDDPVFPIHLARKMVPQFKNCKGLVSVPRTKLLPHEEQPDPVGRLALEFLLGE
jgi:pimeloyl-ACP methyl ester carboxylesterase